MVNKFILSSMFYHTFFSCCFQNALNRAASSSKCKKYAKKFNGVDSCTINQIEFSEKAVIVVMKNVHE